VLPVVTNVLKQAIRAVTLIVVAGSLVVLMVLGLGPHTGRYRTLTVLSGSMRPTIRPGSVVFVTPTPLHALHVGDVITYQVPVDDHRLVTHRVVQILQGGDHPVVRTQGDANSSPDPWEARLEGGTAWRVRAAVPVLGNAIHALRNPQIGRVLLWLVPLILAVVWLRDIWAPTGRERSPTSTDSLPSTGV